MQYLKKANIGIVDSTVKQISQQEYYNYQNVTVEKSKGCYLEIEYDTDISKGESTILLVKKSNFCSYQYESLPQFMNTIKTTIREELRGQTCNGNFIHVPGFRQSRSIEEETRCLKIFFPSFYDEISRAVLRHSSFTPNFTKLNQSYLQLQEFEPITPSTVKIDQPRSLSYEEEIIKLLRRELEIIERNNKKLEDLIIAKKTEKERTLISIISIDPQYSERNNPINSGDWERRKDYYIRSALMTYFPQLKNCCDKNATIQSMFEKLPMENLQAHYEKMAQEAKEKEERKPKKKLKQSERVRE